MNQKSRSAVFLDRDGVLIENVSTYVRTWDDVCAFPYTTSSLDRLKELGFQVFVVTNQAIVGRGLMSLETVQDLHRKIIELVDPHHVITKSYLCPHHPDENCLCRKPLPGSLVAASQEFGIDLSRSFMVGDAISDVEAGINAGTQAILVKTGRGKTQAELLTNPHVPIVDNLSDAVDWIESHLNAQIQVPQ